MHAYKIVWLVVCVCNPLPLKKQNKKVLNNMTMLVFRREGRRRHADPIQPSTMTACNVRTQSSLRKREGEREGSAKADEPDDVHRPAGVVAVKQVAKAAAGLTKTEG